MEKETFLAEENWYGGSYDLVIKYFPLGDDQRLLKAFQAFYDIPCLSGFWFDKNSFGRPPDMLHSFDRDRMASRCGLIEVAQSQPVAWSAYLPREPDGSDWYGSDWLVFGIPVGMLDLVFDISYPITRNDNPWLPQVDQIYVDIATAVYQSSPFDLAIIGEEAFVFRSWKKITPDELEIGGYILPGEKAGRFRQLPPSVSLNDDLRWFPPTWP